VSLEKYEGGSRLRKSEHVHKILKKYAQVLNLKAHKALDGQVIVVHSDIEVHTGEDGLIYVSDTARLYPSEWTPRSGSAIRIHPNIHHEKFIERVKLNESKYELSPLNF